MRECFLAPSPLGNRRALLRTWRRSTAHAGTLAEQGDWTLGWRGDQSLKVDQKNEGTEHADQTGDLDRLSAFETNQSALGNTSFMSQPGLSEIALEPVPRESHAKLTENRRVGLHVRLITKCHSCPQYQCWLFKTPDMALTSGLTATRLAGPEPASDAA